MRRVAKTKRRLNFKDILRSGLITLQHYISFYIYTFVILIIKWAVSDQSFFPDITSNGYNWWVIYVLVFAPMINSILHLIYTDQGNPWLRIVGWMHVLVVIIMIPILVFAI